MTITRQESESLDVAVALCAAHGYAIALLDPGKYKLCDTMTCSFVGDFPSLKALMDYFENIVII